MIKIRDLRKTFAAGTLAEVRALDGINLDIAAGEFVVVLGANGSGKSTLLNAMAGTLTVDSGTIALDGTEVTTLPDHERCRWVARIFQNPLHGTAPDLTVLENFRLASLRTRKKGFRIGTGEDFKKRVRETISTLDMGLEKYIHEPMGILSGGQRQALALLMATFDSTKVLLLDEPTAALDPRTASLVMRLAERLIREHGWSAMMVTHELPDALRFGDRLLFMEAGKIRHDYSGKTHNELTINDLLKWFEV